MDRRIGQCDARKEAAERAIVARIVVPLVPPSVNHYKMRTRRGVTFVSREAKAFKAELIVCARAQSDPTLSGAPAYCIDVTVFQGAKQRGDVDNYAKCVLDGLAEAGVIHSDAAVTDLTLRKRRDRENPRTEITIEGLP